MPTDDPRRPDHGRPAPPVATTWLRGEAVIATRLLLIGAAALLAGWLVHRVEPVAVAAFLGFAQVALLWPVAVRLRRFLPRVVAALAATLGFLAIFGGLVWFVVQGLVTTWPDLVDAVMGGVKAVEQAALAAGWDVPQSLIDDLLSQLSRRSGTIAGGIGSATMTGLSALGTLGTILLIALFLTIFALTSGDDLWRSIRAAFPARRRGAADAACARALVTARWWMLASTLTGLVDGFFIGAGLWLLGVPLAVPLGALTFVLGYIPMIGATVAGALAVVVALFFGGVTTALWALLLVLLVQQIEGNVLSPLLLSRAVSFHPVVTLLLSTGGGVAFGVVGLFLAVPVAGILYAVTVTWRRHGACHDAPGPDGAAEPAPADPSDAHPSDAAASHG